MEIYMLEIKVPLMTHCKDIYHEKFIKFSRIPYLSLYLSTYLSSSIHTRIMSYVKIYRLDANINRYIHVYAYAHRHNT